MSKAVLAMDMPERCSECNLSYTDDCDNWWCSARNCTVFDEIIDENGKPSWCPLKPLPQMKERCSASFDYDGGYCHGIVHGHNDVIKKILEDINE